MSRFSVFVTPRAWTEIQDLPGYVRQRVRRAVDALAHHPRPPRSKRLEAPEPRYELYRLRLDRWRIVYAVTEEERIVDVLAVRKRPPYDYADLQELLANMS